MKIQGGLAALGAAAAVGLGVALYGYLARGSGIDQTEGALLVVCSTGLLLLATLALMLIPRRPAALTAVLAAGLVLDLLGTALAAWFLHAWILLAAMGVGLVGWIAWLALPASRDHRTQEARS